MILSYIVIILMIALNIALHEGGHMAACRIFHLPVKEFSVGMGKALFTFTDRHGTKIKFSPVLLSGYCAYDDNEFNKLPYWKQVIILLAGVTVNFILSILSAFIGLFLISGELMTSFLGGILMQGKFFIMFGNAVASVISGGFDLHPGSISDTVDMTSVLIGGLGEGLSAQLGGAFLISSIIAFVFAVGNLIPIPSLDGGQLITQAIGKISLYFGKDIYKKIEKLNLVFFVGISLLMCVYILYDVGGDLILDVLKIFQKS